MKPYPQVPTAAAGSVLSFHTHFTGAAPPCVRSPPSISTGMLGEWTNCISDSIMDNKCDFKDNAGIKAALTGFIRKTRHLLNNLGNRCVFVCLCMCVSLCVSLSLSLSLCPSL